MPKFVSEPEILCIGAQPELQAILEKSCVSLRPDVHWVQSQVTSDKINCVYFHTSPGKGEQ